MMKTIFSVASFGLQARIVQVEVDIAAGLPSFTIVGLPDTAVQEARERVRAALKNMKVTLPPRRITINLAPAHIKKQGSLYDVPMALGLIALQPRSAIIPPPDAIFLGELALDGHIRAVEGCIVLAKGAQEAGYKELFLPAENAPEASLISGITIRPVQHLQEIEDHLTGRKPLPTFDRKALPKNPKATTREHIMNFDHISGQILGKRALTIAAAGAHNILFIGPPGSGKTMLAQSILSILPPLSETEMIEATQVHSIGGHLNSRQTMITEPPFRAPHHTASTIALIGGGSWPKPGEISLAHRGVLFLDEFPEFHRSLLEALRQPLEDRVVTISRAHGSLTFPAHIMLVAAQNPCPCGYRFDEQQSCRCTAYQILEYEKKLSGPLMDRIDIVVEIPKVPTQLLLEEKKEKIAETKHAKALVQNAREIQQERFRKQTLLTNAEMRNEHLRRYAKLQPETKKLLVRAAESLHLSARGIIRVIKVARTIADIENEHDIRRTHIQEALQYRIRKE